MTSIVHSTSVNSTSSIGSTNGTSNLVIGSKYKPNLRTSFSIDKLSSKYNEIIDLLLSPDLELVGAICSQTLVKEVAQNGNINISEALVLFFEIHCNLKSPFLLKWAIDREIENTNNGPTLFRGLSIATRLISAFYKRIGESYLKYLLKPFILDIVSRNFSFEIDPEKAGKGMNIQNNLEKLITITQQVLDKILDSLDQCPQPIRNILHHTQDRVEKKFPFMKTTVIGGFIFLRFICPAIVAPEIFGLTSESPSTDSRRGLVLVSKLLQNLANEMPFGVGIKEEYMQYLNDFITNNAERIHLFFDKLASNTSSLSKDSNSTSNSGNSTNGSNANGASTATNSESNASSTNTQSNSTSSNNSPLLSKESSKSKLNLPSAKEYLNDTNSSITNSNSNSTNQLQQNFTDEMILNNLNIIINQIVDNKEKIETILSSEITTPELAQDIIKKLENALQSLKQKNLSTKLMLWKRTKDTNTSNGNSSKSSGNSKNHNNTNNIKSVNNNTHSNSHHHHINGKHYNDIQEEEVQISLSNSIQDYSNYYKHKLELKDIELKSAIDELSFLKKESDDARFRSNIVKKLREELDVEKRKRRETEIQFSKLLERLKILGDDNINEIIQDIQISDHESTLSTSDLSSLIEETLEISSAPTSTNSTLKKRRTQVGVPLKKSLNAQPTHAQNKENSSENGDMKRSTTTGTISDHSNSTCNSTTSQTPSQNLSISTSNLDQSTNTIIHGVSKATSAGSTILKSHSRNNSNSEYNVNSEMTSSESNPTFDLESEDRIVQAYVDGELEEDDQGMDLLEFLKEVHESHLAKKASEQHISVSSSDNTGDNENIKKKRSSMGIFKLPKFSSKDSKDKKKTKSQINSNDP